MVNTTKTQNETTVLDYSQFRLKAEKISKSTVRTQQYHLIDFSRTLKKPFKQANEEDVISFLDNYKDTTRDTMIATLRKFYKWLYKLEPSDRLPDCIRNIRPTPLRVRRKEKESVYKEREITEDEYQRLIDNAKTPMHKAMIETLYLFGVRVGELLSMNATDVVYDGEFTRITVRDSKTMPRDVPYKGRAKYLMPYFESYQPFKEQPGKPLWTNQDNERFSKRGMLNLIERTTKYANIGRRITNHDFRHTSISRDLRDGVPLTHVETKHGLTHGSQVIKTYDHNKTKNYEDWLNGKIAKTPETYETLKRKNEQLVAIEKEKYDKLDKVNDHMMNEIRYLKHRIDDMSYYREEDIIAEEKVKEYLSKFPTAKERKRDWDRLYNLMKTGKEMTTEEESRYWFLTDYIQGRMRKEEKNKNDWIDQLISSS